MSQVPWTVALSLAAVACSSDGGPSGPPLPTTGSIVVRTSTSGQSLDEDGYLITLDSGVSRSVGANDSVVYLDVAPGTHQMSIAGLADNCTLGGPDSLSVVVTAGATTRLNAGVSCARVFRNEILFVSRRDGNPELYVMHANGTSQARLTFNPAPDHAPAVAVDGRRLAFASTRSGNDDLYVMDADGTGLIPVTLSPFYDFDPTWSPDGTKIAYVSNQQIWVMSANGTGHTRLTNDSTVLFNDFPDWSPDGARIAFYSDRAGNADIYVMDPDGTNEARLTSAPSIDFQPAWSPNGQKIAFVSDRDGNMEIYTMNADGSAVARLTFDTANDFHPSWSPDGTKIVFQSNRAGANKADIWVVNSDGTTPVRLTTAAGDNTYPKWTRGP